MQAWITCAEHPAPRQDRALAPDAQKPHPARKLLPTGRPRSAHRSLRRSLQSPALPRKPAEPDTGRRLLWTRPNHPASTRKDQTRNHQKETIAPPEKSSLTSNGNRARTSFRESLRTVAKHMKTDTPSLVVIGLHEIVDRDDRILVDEGEHVG